MIALNATDLVMIAVTATAVALFIGLRWGRLEPASRRARDLLPPLTAAMAFLALFVAGPIGQLATAHLLPGDLSEEMLAEPDIPTTARLMAGGYAAQLLMLAVLLYAARPPAPPPAAPGDRAGGGGRMGLGRAVLLGAGGCVLFWPMVFASTHVLREIAERMTGQELDEIAHDTLRELSQAPTDAWYFAMAAMIVLAAPVVEEALYRLCLHSMLFGAGLGRWTTIVVASALFAVIHLSVAAPHAVGALFVLSLGFGWVYEKSGRLAAPVTMHALFNAANLTLVHLVQP